MISHWLDIPDPEAPFWQWFPFSDWPCMSLGIYYVLRMYVSYSEPKLPCSRSLLFLSHFLREVREGQDRINPQQSCLSEDEAWHDRNDLQSRSLAVCRGVLPGFFYEFDGIPGQSGFFLGQNAQISIRTSGGKC